MYYLYVKGLWHRHEMLEWKLPVSQSIVAAPYLRSASFRNQLFSLLLQKKLSN